MLIQVNVFILDIIFDDMINIKSLDPNKIKIDKNHTKIFLFIILDM